MAESRGRSNGRTEGSRTGGGAVDKANGSLSYINVADHIRSQILSGELLPGDRLPPEAALSAELGVSRLTLREGIRALMSEKLITTRRGNTGGTFVAHPSATDVVAALGRALQMMTATDRLSTRNIVEAWVILEGPVARLAAEGRTDAEVAELYSNSEPPVGLSEAEAAERAYRFHAVLGQATRNPLLPMLTRPLSSIVPEHFAPVRARPTFWTRAMKDLREVAKAVEAKDGAAAEEAMIAHIRRMGQRPRSGAS